MLKEFRVRNFMNFRDELIFSLENKKSYEFNNDLISNGIIEKAAVIGYNASGKSNLGEALLDIANHITDVAKTTVSKGLYTNLYSQDKEAHFSYTFQFDKNEVIYQYDKIDPITVTRERVWINKKEVLRKDNDSVLIDLAGAETVNIDNMNSTISLVRYVYANTALDKSDIYSNTFIKFVEFVKGMLMISATDTRKYAGFTNVQGNMFSLICDLDHGVEDLEKFLHSCEIDYKLVEMEDEEGKNIYCKYDKKIVKLSSLCSSGTRALVFFFYWRKQCKDIKFMYIDEFDAFYHTDLALSVVKLLIKEKGEQVVVSTHNTDIISNEILRPDCYFELGDNKLLPLYQKTTKALRQAHNLQKMYKAGAFNEQPR